MRKEGEAVSQAKESGEDLGDDKDYKYKRIPMAHQRKAFLLSRDRKAFGLFMEQGTGKTKVVIDNACYLYRKGLIDFLVIVAWPNGVHRNWVDYELPEDMGVPYVAEWWNSKKKSHKYKVSLRKILLQKNKLRVLTFNVEAFTSSDARELIEEIVTNNKVLFVIDQSASIKNPQAKRTKFLTELGPKAAFRRVLDGAPVAEGADELYSQFRFLDPRIIGHDTWTGFKAEFCTIGFFNQIDGYKNLPELRRRIDGHCFRVLADECLDLPERVYKKWVFDLTENEQRIFDELRKQDIAHFSRPLDLESDDAIDFESPELLKTAHALTKNLRLQQVSSGWFADQTGGGARLIEERPSRLEAFLSLIEAAPGKCLVFSRFRRDLVLLQSILGDKAVSYHGKIGEEERARAKKLFMDPKSGIDYFLGQPRSAGIGHTLTAAKHVIFYANDDSLRLREECEKRAHRTGLKHRLIVWDLMATGTQDSKIVKSLRAKKLIANEILQDPESFFLVHDQ